MRAASGAVYAALVLGAAWAGTETTFLLFLVIALLASLEFRALLIGSNRPVESTAFTIGLTLFFYAVVPTVVWTKHTEPITLSLVGLVILAVVVGAIWRERNLKLAVFRIALALYIALPLLCACWMVGLDPLLFIGFMLLLWTNDSGAYLVGKAIGRHKLMPTVSPGKTWEGFVGGVLLTVLLAWPISRLSDALPLQGWLIAASGISFAATIGDLFESWMKRRAGVKDSGRIMPGHGGVLDRFDGYLLAAPVMVLIAYLFSA